MLSASVLNPQTPSQAPARRAEVGGVVRWLVFWVSLAALGYAYFYGSALQCVFTRAREFTPLEKRYLEVREATQEDLRPDFSQSFSEPLKRLVPHRTDGVVQPLWPWMAAFLPVDHAANNPVDVANGVQLWWTLGWLVIMAIICARRFTLPAALLVVLIAGYEGFLPTVGPFTGEALFQVLFLLSWVTCIYALQRNSLWAYGLVGAIGALTYLAEDRVLPLLITFIISSTLRACWEWVLAHFRHGLEEGTTTTQWVPGHHLLGLLTLGAVFVFMVSPRLAESHDRFGNAFFVYHDHVRWLDSTEEAEAWIKAHPASHSLPLKNPGELVRGYQESHSGEVAWNRFQTGLRGVWADFSRNGGFPLGMLFSLLVVMAIAMRWAAPKAAHAGQRLHPETIPALLFMLTAAGAYVVIAAWDAPIDGTTGRLSLLQAPMALGIVWGMERLFRRACRRQAATVFQMGYRVCLWGMFVWILWPIIQWLQPVLFRA